MDHFNEAYFSTEEHADEKVSRQKHAMGMLADKILEVLPYAPEKDEAGFECESWEMTVDQIGKKYGARVGSVYEVFHVFESLLLASKIGPKTYRWNGFAQMKTTLSFLQYIGVYCLNLPQEMEEVQEIEIDAILSKNTFEPSNRKRDINNNSNTSLNPNIENLINNDVQSAFYSCDDSKGSIQCSETDNTSKKQRKRDWRRVKKEHENIYEDKTSHILQVIQKFIMLYLVPSRIHRKDKKSMSLSYAAKVIHGVNSLPEDILLARTRRLYDIANILVSISKRCADIAERTPELGYNSGEEIFSMRKVRVSNSNCVRRTTIQYQGPDVQPLQITDIMNLPDHRREYLYFSDGKSALGIPEKPISIPRTTCIRLTPVEGGDPRQSISEGLSLSRLAVTDMKKPISLEDIVYLESMRRNMSLNEENVDDHRNDLAHIDQKDLWLAILPGQQSVKECFTNGSDAFLDK